MQPFIMYAKNHLILSFRKVQANDIASLYCFILQNVMHSTVISLKTIHSLSFPNFLFKLLVIHSVWYQFFSGQFQQEGAVCGKEPSHAIVSFNYLSRKVSIINQPQKDQQAYFHLNILCVPLYTRSSMLRIHDTAAQMPNKAIQLRTECWLGLVVNEIYMNCRYAICNHGQQRRTHPIPYIVPRIATVICNGMLSTIMQSLHFFCADVVCSRIALTVLLAVHHSTLIKPLCLLCHHLPQYNILCHYTLLRILDSRCLPSHSGSLVQKIFFTFMQFIFSLNLRNSCLIQRSHPMFCFISML